MKQSELVQRVKELEAELKNIKSGQFHNDSLTLTATQGIASNLSLITDNFPAFISYINAETLRYEYVNAHYEKVLGIPRSKIIGSHVKEAIGKNNFAISLKYIDKVKEESRAITFEEELITRNGKKWYHGEYFPVFGNGNVIGISVLCYEISERKKIQKARDESDERFRQLFQEAPLGYQSLDINGNFIDVNERWLELLGYSKEEVTGRWFGDFLSPEYKEAFKERFPVFLKEGKIHSEFEMIHKNGNKLFISFEGKIGLDTDLNFKQTHCILQDITHEKLTNELLVENESRLRLYLDNSPMAIIECDSESKILRWTGKSESIFGWKSEEVIGKNIFSLNMIHEADKSIVNNVTRGINENGKVQVFDCNRNIRKDGRIITCEWYNIVLRNKNGLIKSILSLVFDITEKKKLENSRVLLEENLKSSEEYFRTVFENNSVAIAIVEPDTKISLVNQKLCSMLKYTKDEICGTSWTKYVFHEDLERLKQSFTLGLLNPPEKPSSYEFRFIQKDKEIRHALMNVTITSNRKVIASYLDITERKELESELIKAKEKAQESDRLKSAFLSNMSHEIRTPLNGILGFTELLKEPLLTFKEQQDYINTISKSGERLLNTLNAILDISRIESGMTKVNLLETNINDKLDFTYRFFRQETTRKDLEFYLSKKLLPEESLVYSDDEKIYSILSNLIKNAIKFTGKGSVEFGCERINEHLRFFVKDTGQGIPENHSELIFERFRQGNDSVSRNYGGNGLGLSISKSYVEMLGGKIWFESEIEKGTTFYFTIPYKGIIQMKTENNGYIENERNSAQDKKLKILIAEDDEVSYTLLIRMIQGISSEIFHARDGVEAVEFCRKNSDLDLVLMDIRMPLLDGLEATKQIRGFNKELIIIAETAYGFSTDCEKALEAGCDDYIPKPINKKALLELIKRYCYK